MTDLVGLIAQCGLPRETKAVFRQIKVKKARISRKKKSLTLVVELPCPISEEDSGFFCGLIQENLPAFQEVVLEVTAEEEKLNCTLAQVIAKERGVLLETLEEKVTGVKNWLHMAKWQCADLPAPDGSGLPGLVLTFPHPFALDILEEKKLPQILGSLIHFRYGLDVLVELKLDEEAGENQEGLGSEEGEGQETIPYDEIDRATLLQYCAVSDSSSSPSSPSSQGTGKKATPTHGDVILGKVIKGELVPLEKIREEERSIAAMGRIISLETRELRSGRTLIIFDLTDDTDSITVKLFTDEKTPDRVFSALKKGAWIKVRGPVQTDKYSQELTLMAYDISSGQAVEREDHAPEKRVELHLHTKMSSLDAVVDTSRAVALAAKWGHKAIAITDHGVVQAFPEAYQAGKENQIKIIYGVEGYLIDDEESDLPWQKQKSHHIIILVKNQGGLLNLYRLISLSHLETYYRKPRILKSVLRKHREGLILGSACEAGELYRGILNKKSGTEIDRIAQFYDYLEIQPLGNNEFLVRNDQVPDRKSLMTINKTIIALGEKFQKPVAATGDVHFIEEGDAIYRKILMAGKGFEDDIQAPLYFRTTEEMLAEFSYLGEETAQKVVIRDPNWIAEQIEEVLPIPQELFPPEIEGAEEQVEEMTRSTAQALYGETLPDLVQARIDKELNSIIKHGFSVLYLIAHKLVKKSNDDGYLVGSRGSVGSSMVATMMGITEVNPLPPHYRCPECRYSDFITDGSVGSGPDLPDCECPQCGKALVKDGHDIPFETFLGFKGDKTPDIDLNFSGDYQPRAHKYVEELFGKDHVFRAGTISTIAERTAFGFVKNYLTERNLEARDAEVNRLVGGCSGVKRTTGQHPGGLMVVPTKLDIHKFSPIQHPADDMKSDIITTHFDYHSISDRLVKLDILGHDDPTVIKMLEDLTGIDAKTIKLDDQETLSLFSGVEVLHVTPKEIRSNVGTYGVPEFGTKFVRQMLEDIRPNSFSDLVRISGFSHGTDVWLNNAQELIRSGTCKTSETISCRDDIMVYLMQKGLEPQIAFKIMEDVRKGKGVKPEYEAAMKAEKVPDWYIDSCKRIKYMFPKAHATAYVTMAYRIAWFKVNFPEAFYASFFSVRADEFDADLMVRGVKGVLRAMDEIEGKGNEAGTKEKNLLTILEVVLEMYQRGFNLLPVSLENSDAEKFQITDRGILPPLSSLQGLGVTAAHNLVAAREEKPFCTWDDIRIRGKASKTVIDMLAAHGCLDHLPESSQMCLF